MLNRARSSAPPEPRPAASVGVAMPARMVPMTARISVRGGIRDFMVMDHFSAAVYVDASSLEMGGPREGSRLHLMNM